MDTEETTRSVPDKTFFIKVGFEFLTGRSLDIEERENAGNVEENNADGEMSSETDPVRGNRVKDFSMISVKSEIGRPRRLHTFYQIRIFSLLDP